MTGRPRQITAAAARQYLAAGWAVIPGSWWSPQLAGYRCGWARCHNSAPHPVSAYPATDGCPPLNTQARPQVWTADSWTRRSYTVLLPTDAITVIAGPAALITRLDERLHAAGYDAPISAQPNGTLELFSQPIPAADDLRLSAAMRGAQLYGRGRWVTLPPSTIRRGPVTWVRSPDDVAWQLPPGEATRTAVSDVLDAAAACPHGV